jgi:uncharacterized repeat protein (TIGR01451 family)
MWLVEQLNVWTVNIVLAALWSGLALLIVLVWKSGPRHEKLLRRVWGGARKRPAAAITAGAVLAMCLVTSVVTTVAMAGGQPTAGGVPVASPSIPASPRPAETTQIATAGWGPARDVATDSKRPQKAMLNSVIDDPDFGDERGFMVARAADDHEARWQNSIVAVPGRVYEIAVVVNNDAADGGEAARDVRLRVQMPAVAKGSAPSHAFVTSDVLPHEIWDGINIVGEDPSTEFALRYVASSAVLHTAGDADGAVLSDNIFAQGVLLGCDQLDGDLPAGERCQSWVTFRIHVDQPNFEVAAFAQQDGADAWSETVVATAGQRVTLMGTYKNTGTTQQNDVVFVVALPENMHYVMGTTSWSNAQRQGVAEDTDNIVRDGINVGSYAPGEDVRVTFDVVLDGEPGEESLQEVPGLFSVETNNGTKRARLALVWL